MQSAKRAVSPAPHKAGGTAPCSSPGAGLGAAGSVGGGWSTPRFPRRSCKLSAGPASRLKYHGLDLLAFFCFFASPPPPSPPGYSSKHAHSSAPKMSFIRHRCFDFLSKKAKSLSYKYVFPGGVSSTICYNFFTPNGTDGI